MEDKTVLRSRRACGDLEYCTFRDSMRADAYAESRKQKLRSYSLLTHGHGLTNFMIFRN